MTTSNKADGFQWAFGLNRLSLNLLGVWPSENHLRNAIVTPTLILVMSFGLIVPQAHALVEVQGQLLLVADTIVTFNVCIVGITKITILWMGRKEITELLRRVYDDWLADKSISELRSMRHHARPARILTIIGLCMTLGCVASYVILPIFKISIRQLNNITDPHPSRVLPLQTYYPYYDVYRSPVYELTCLHQMIAAFLTGTAFCVPDNFFGALVLHACGQCEILGATFERLAASALTTDSTTFVGTLRRVVSRHIRLILFVNDVESLFNMMILAHLLDVVVTVAFLGLLCVEAFGRDAKSPPLIQVVTLAGSSATMLLQSLVYCSTAEMLATRSCRLLETTYLSSLHSIPKSRARDLTMIMMHSREPLKLTAGKILDLSHNTFLQLVKNVFGYISMLITMNQSH